MIYKINGKVYSKSEFVKRMKRDLAKEYLFTHDILSDHLDIDIDSLSQKEIENATNSYVDNHLDQMIEFISQYDYQEFSSNRYTINK